MTLSKRLLGHPKEGKAVCLLFIGQMYSFFYYLPEFHYRQMTHNAFLVSCFESKRTNVEVMYDEDELNLPSCFNTAGVDKLYIIYNKSVFV